MPPKIKGFSLLEVLISLLLLSIALLGNQMLEAYAAQQLKLSNLINTATVQITNISERLRMLQDAIGLEEQIASWNAELKIVLPNGVGEVEGNFPEYVISLYWGKKINCEKNILELNGCIREKIYVG